MGNIYQYDVGKEFRVDCKIDLSQSTARKLYVLTPTGEAIWTPTVTTGQTEYGETEGSTILRYISQVNDLVQLGTYILVSYGEWTTSSKHYGEPAKFKVYEKYKT